MWKKVIIIASSVIGAMIIAGGGYAYYLYHSVKDTADQIYEPVDDGDKEQTKATPDDKPKKDKEPSKSFSILLRVSMKGKMTVDVRIP
jgi:hypothetical protein